MGDTAGGVERISESPDLALPGPCLLVFSRDQASPLWKERDPHRRTG